MGEWANERVGVSAFGVLRREALMGI